MNTPHICIVTTVHDPFDTRIYHRQARSLAAAGYRVTLLAQGAPEATRDGVRLCPLPPRQFSLGARGRGVWIAWRAALAVAADAYHLHDPELTPVAALLRLAGRRVVLDIHEHTPYHLLEKPYLPRPLRWPLALLYDGWERLATRLFCDRVITVGETIARRFPRGKTVIVRNLPDLDRFTAHPARPADPAADGTVTAIYMGVVERPRGLLNVVRAARRLPDDVPLRIRIVGPCPFPDFAAELRAAGGDRLLLEPAVPYEQVPALLAEAHFGLELALPTRLNRLLWPRKVFEYMAAGLPVLRADYPAWQSFAPVGTVAIDPTNAAAITAALRDLATDSALRARLGAQGAQLARERYTWAEEARKLVAMYADLLGE